MPSVESNTIFECQRCGSKLDAEGREEELRARGCPNCGHDTFRQLVVQPVCDFCSENLAGPCWTYPCSDFKYQIPNAPNDGSLGDWAACDVCHALIEADDRTGLIRRAVEAERVRHPEYAHLHHEAWAVTARIQKGFHEHRTGEAYRDSTDNHRKEEGR